MCELTPNVGSVTAQLLGPLLTGDPHIPRLVLYAGTARTELSTASLANWSAKVAGLLVDELGTSPGDPIAVRLGAGWQTAPILLGCWWAGAVVTDADDPGAGAAFVADGQDARADEVFVVSGHPLGAPSVTVLAHQRDFTTSVLGQADTFTAGPVLTDTAPAVYADGSTLSVGQVVRTARSAGERFGAKARVLSDAPWTLPDPLVPLLLGALAADGSLVQSVGKGGSSAEHLADVEKCTVRWS